MVGICMWTKYVPLLLNKFISLFQFECQHTAHGYPINIVVSQPLSGLVHAAFSCHPDSHTLSSRHYLYWLLNDTYYIPVCVKTCLHLILYTISSSCTLSASGCCNLRFFMFNRLPMNPAVEWRIMDMQNENMENEGETWRIDP